MLGDVVEAAASVGEVRVVTADAAGRLVAGELGATAVDDPGEGQGAAVAAALEGVDGICLIVNADLPRVRPSDLAALAVPPRLGRVALVASADGRTNALGLPYAEIFRPLYGPDSAGAFGRTCSSSASTSRSSRCRTSSRTSTRQPTSTGSARAGARGRARSWRRSRGEGRLPLGRSRRREARTRSLRRPRVGPHGRGQRRRRPRGARAARLARPRLRALRARRPQRRGARLGSRGRDLARARVGAGVGRRRVVPAGRSRHRAPPRPRGSARVRRATLVGERGARPGSRNRRSPAPGDRRRAAHARS